MPKSWRILLVGTTLASLRLMVCSIIIREIYMLFEINFSTLQFCAHGDKNAYMCNYKHNKLVRRGYYWVIKGPYVACGDSCLVYYDIDVFCYAFVLKGHVFLFMQLQLSASLFVLCG